jgi:proline iminopeptidase
MGILVAVAVAALAAWLINFALPRGPTTLSQALILLACSLSVGLIADISMRSAWAILLVPFAHVIVLEFSRPQLLGPTVGTLRLNEVYGVLAFILGRGLYALVALVPMLIGAYLGVVIANAFRVDGGTVRWIPVTVSSAVLVALAVWIALPASTPAILENGNPVPGSIAELTTVRLGGHDQTIMVRAYSADKPVLLFLNGGPGQSGLAFSRVMLNDLARDFVIVDWDQRGTGKSYAAFEPTSTLTLEQAINDTLELANYLRQRFDEPKFTCSANRGEPPWGYWRCSAIQLCFTPSSAVVRWSANAKPTGVCTRMCSSLRRETTTINSPAKCAVLVNHPTRIFRLRTPS